MSKRKLSPFVQAAIMNKKRKQEQELEDIKHQIEVAKLKQELNQLQMMLPIEVKE